MLPATSFTISVLQWHCDYADAKGLVSYRSRLILLQSVIFIVFRSYITIVSGQVSHRVLE